MYMHIYCLHVFAMLFTGPFQPERYVCFVLPKNKSLPSECGFYWNLCQPSQDVVLACPVQWLPAYKPPEIVRDVPATAAFSAVLHYPDFPETGNRSQGCHRTLVNTLGTGPSQQPCPDWIGPSHRVSFVLVHITGTRLCQSKQQRSLEKAWTCL